MTISGDAISGAAISGIGTSAGQVAQNAPPGNPLDFVVLGGRFPLPEAYQKLPTVRPNADIVSFPALGSWLPGTMGIVNANSRVQMALKTLPAPSPVPPIAPAITKPFQQNNPAYYPAPWPWVIFTQPRPNPTKNKTIRSIFEMIYWP